MAEADEGGTMSGIITNDAKRLRAAARQNVRRRGVGSTLMGLQVMGMADEELGFTAEHYKQMMAGVAEQMVRDAKKAAVTP